jgi:hypothetical protein
MADLGVEGVEVVAARLEEAVGLVEQRLGPRTGLHPGEVTGTTRSSSCRLRQKVQF